MTRRKIIARLTRSFIAGWGVAVIIFFAGFPSAFASAADDFLIDLGVEHFRKGFLDDAEIEFRKALIIDPDNSRARAYLAKIREKRKASLDTKQEARAVCLGEEKVYEIDCFDDHCYPRYLWDFGDRTDKKEGLKVTHKYLNAGRYAITVLGESFQEGLSYASSMGVIRVRVNTPPVADAGPNLVCCKGKVVLFDASGSYDPDGDRLTYLWDFGDGHRARGIKVRHAYPKHGKYRVVLTVSDNAQSGCSVSTSGFTAHVHARPVAVMEIRGNNYQ